MTSAEETGLARVLMIIIALVLVIAFILALTGFTTPPSPPAWLVDWTSWLVSALGAIFAPLVLVSATQALRKLSRE